MKENVRDIVLTLFVIIFFIMFVYVMEANARHGSHETGTCTNIQGAEFECSAKPE